MTNAAYALLNLKLADDWVVTEEFKPGTPGTGGQFSVCYLVTNSATGKTGFLKALNLESAFSTPGDLTTNLENLTKAYNFERDVLRKCAAKGMSKVVVPIADGTAVVPGHAISQVPYIIFERAGGQKL